MSTYEFSSGSLNVRVSGRSSLVNSLQEITLRAALNRAISLLSDCFDNCDREADPNSVYSKQAKACEENYTKIDNHKTTLDSLVKTRFEEVPAILHI